MRHLFFILLCAAILAVAARVVHTNLPILSAYEGSMR